MTLWETMCIVTCVCCLARSIVHAVVLTRAAAWTDLYLEDFERFEGYIDPLESFASTLLGVD